MTITINDKDYLVSDKTLDYTQCMDLIESAERVLKLINNHSFCTTVFLHDSLYLKVNDTAFEGKIDKKKLMEAILGCELTEIDGNERIIF